MSRYARRVDKNQQKVVGELRDLGFSIAHTHTVGKGFPDFVVGFYQYNILVELKSENGKLTKHEISFKNNYNGYVIVGSSTLSILNQFLEYIIYIDNFSLSYAQQRLGAIIKEYEYDNGT